MADSQEIQLTQEIADFPSLKLVAENFDNLSDRLVSLDERTRDWLTGKTSWLSEKYINFKVGILLEIHVGSKTNRISHGKYVAD